MKPHRMVLPLLGAILFGCTDPLVPAEEIKGLRILGAKVSATDEPSRAALDPGEAAKIDWLVVSSSNEPYAARAVFCLAKQTTLGLQECSQAPFDTRVQSAQANSPLQLTFELPARDEQTPWLAWLGACSSENAKDAPDFDWHTRNFSCPHGEPSVEGVYEGQPIGKDPPNRNPDLGDDSLKLGKSAWQALPDAPPPGAHCTGTSLPRVHPGKTTTVHWRVEVDDREPLETHGQYAAPTRESLVFTHVATSLGLARAFSALDWDSDSNGFDVDFTLPAKSSPPSKGRSILVYLVTQDGRGGTDWLQRELCAVP
ncbi:MAG TPA: hypothetical protein VHM70_16935 [Polyangiaceae bacterium]|nr:hypothetical protein [Polyangiaceae bacterium]